MSAAMDILACTARFHGAIVEEVEAPHQDIELLTVNGRLVTMRRVESIGGSDEIIESVRKKLAWMLPK